MNKKFQLFIGVLVISLAFFLRVYELPSSYQFLGDQGRDMIVVKNMIEGSTFQLLGPTSSIGGYYLGPFFYYLIAPSAWIAQGNPLGPALFQAMIGTATVALVFLLYRKELHFYEKTAIGLFLALSPSLILQSRFAWNPNPIPFFLLLWAHHLSQFYEKFETKDWVWSMVWLAILLQLHLTTLVLIPISGVVLLLKSYQSKTKSKVFDWKKLVANSLIAVVLTGLSLGPFLIGVVRKSSIESSGLSFTSLQEIWGRLSTVVNTVPGYFFHLSPFSFLASLLGFMLCVAIGFVFFLFWKNQKNQRNPVIEIFADTLALSILALSLISSPLEAHYLLLPLTALPFVFVGFIRGISNLTSSRTITKIIQSLVITCLLLSLISGFSTYITQKSWTQNSPSVNQVREVAETVTQLADDQPFNLAVLSETNTADSYAYFLLQDKAPLVYKGEPTNQVFVICEQTECPTRSNPEFEIARIESLHPDQVTHQIVSRLGEITIFSLSPERVD